MSEPNEARRSPLIALLDRLSDLLGARGEEGSLRESVREVLEEHASDGETLSPEARLMLMNILSLGELRVEDIMVPRADIIAIEIDTSLDDTVRLFREAGHARLPIYRETLDDPVGFASIEQLIAWWPLNGAAPQSFSLDAIRRDVLFVPPSMRAIDLLLKMRTSGTHLALVVDEYGGTDGMATIADLIEEIVGEIDYRDDEPVMIEPVSGGYLADARVPIDEVEELTGLTLVGEELEEEIDTIGGLVASLVGRVPQRGELVRHPAGITFEIVDADPRRIKRIRLHLPGSRRPDEGDVT